MRKLLVFTLVIGGAAAGVAVGYALATLEAASKTPFLDPNHSNKPGFDGVVVNFAKLGGYESVAADCNGTSPTRLALSAEAEIVHDLQGRTLSDQDVVSVAEAKLLVRTMIITEKTPRANLQPDGAQRAEDLLKSAGWTNPSAAHMRELIQVLDQDQCRQVVLPTGGQR